MYNKSRLVASTLSLPARYVKGVMEIDEEKAEKILKDAYRNGIRYFMAATQYLMGKCEEFVGRTLKDVRSNISLSTNYRFFDPDLPKENPVIYSLKKSLEAFQTDYIDCLNFYGHFVKPEELREAQKAKETGIIRHIAIILDPHMLYNAKDMIEKASPVVDTVIAFCSPTNHDHMKILTELKRDGIRIIAGAPPYIGSESMPGNIPDIDRSIENISATEIAVRYFLKQEVFDDVIFILKEKEYLELMCECERSMDKYTTGQLEPYFRKEAAISGKPAIICSGCGYCLPCPKGIDITKLFNIYAYYEQYGMHDCALHSFINYRERLGGCIDSICVNCGICEKRCPQRTSIGANLRELEKFMESLSMSMAL